MLKCLCCGEIFDNDEVATRTECVGEFWGTPAYMDFDICPFCNCEDLEDYEEETEDDEEEAGESE